MFPSSFSFLWPYCGRSRWCVKGAQNHKDNCLSVCSDTVRGESFKYRWKLFLLPSKHAYISCIHCKICRSLISTRVNFQHQIWTFVQQWIIRTDKYFLTSLQHKTKIASIAQNEDKEKELCCFMWLLRLLRGKTL